MPAGTVPPDPWTDDPAAYTIWLFDQLDAAVTEERARLLLDGQRETVEKLRLTPPR